MTYPVTTGFENMKGKENQEKYVNTFKFYFIRRNGLNFPVGRNYK